MHAAEASSREQPGFSQPLEITFENRGDRLIGLGAKNGMLKVVTLGMYSFWAKTEIRRRLWSFTRINGEPLEYTGTGKELFQGFLIIFLTVLLPVMLGGVAVGLLSGKSKTALSLYQLAVYGVFSLLIGNAMYRAQRYRLSRTRWRGIRGALIGSPARYGWTYFWTLAVPFGGVLILAGLVAWLSAPEVGGAVIFGGLIAGLWVLPWRANRLQAHLVGDTYVGNQKLNYTGTATPLYKNYVFAWCGSAVLFVLAFWAVGRILFGEGVLSQWQAARIPPSPAQAAQLIAVPVVTIIAWALITAWYRATQMRHFAEHTHLDHASFRSSVSGKGLVWLTLSNWLLTGLGFLLAVITASALIYGLGAAPEPALDQRPADPGPAAILLMLTSLAFFTTAAAAFAQFRSARYFMSRLKLEGPVNLASILQSDQAGPKRGEGLAQMFDLDAF